MQSYLYFFPHQVWAELVMQKKINKETESLHLYVNKVNVTKTSWSYHLLHSFFT